MSILYSVGVQESFVVAKNKIYSKRFKKYFFLIVVHLHTSRGSTFTKMLDVGSVRGRSHRARKQMGEQERYQRQEKKKKFYSIWLRF